MNEPEHSDIENDLIYWHQMYLDEAQKRIEEHRFLENYFMDEWVSAQRALRAHMMSI